MFQQDCVSPVEGFLDLGVAVESYVSRDRAPCLAAGQHIEKRRLSRSGRSHERGHLAA